MSHKVNKQITVFLLASLVIALFSTSPLFSATSSSGNVKLITSTSPEAKIEVGYNVSFPFLQGDSMLTSGNNVKIKSILGVSPIAVTAQVDAILTPLAIMEVNLGIAAGTGWDFNALGLDLQGIKLGPNITGPFASDSLGGAYLKGRVGAALQFDTGVLLEGPWKSILMRTYHELNYQYYTGATSSEWWEYENGGVKENAFNYKGEYVVGYNMPIIVNTVGLMLEHTINSVFTAANTTSDFVLGLITNVEFFDGLNLTLIPQVNLNSGIEWKRLVLMVNYSF